jgi:hypothetical protein
MPFSAFFWRAQKDIFCCFSPLYLRTWNEGGSYTYSTKILPAKPLTLETYYKRQSARKLAYLCVIFYQVYSSNVSGLRYWRSCICFWTHLVQYLVGQNCPLLRPVPCSTVLDGPLTVLYICWAVPLLWKMAKEFFTYCMWSLVPVQCKRGPRQFYIYISPYLYLSRANGPWTALQIVRLISVQCTV